MRPVLGASFLVLALGPTSGLAQTAQDVEVRATVKQALDGLAQRDIATLQAVFDPSAMLVLVSYNDDASALAQIPTRAIMQSLDKPGPRRREELRDERIVIAADLATVIADYAFYLDDVLHHCGKAMYDLVRVEGRWRILQIRQTDRRSGCSP
jgi:hypothetical protein